jgi:hypothetical protein
LHCGICFRTVLDKGIGVSIGIDTILRVDLGLDSKPLDFVARGAKLRCAAANDPYFHRFILFDLGSLFEAGSAMVTPTVV